MFKNVSISLVAISIIVGLVSCKTTEENRLVGVEEVESTAVFDSSKGLAISFQGWYNWGDTVQVYVEDSLVLERAIKYPGVDDYEGTLTSYWQAEYSQGPVRTMIGDFKIQIEEVGAFNELIFSREEDGAVTVLKKVYE